MIKSDVEFPLFVRAPTPAGTAELKRLTERNDFLTVRRSGPELFSQAIAIQFFSRTIVHLTNMNGDRVQ